MDEMQTSVVNHETENVSEIKPVKEQIRPSKKNIIIACALLLLAVVALIICLCNKPDAVQDDHEVISIELISELTSLECRYHNVSIYKEDGNIFGIGKKYVWFEYDVIVKAGIDMEKVRIEQLTEDGVIKIYLPPAEILSVDVDEATIQKIVEEVGAFTEITTDEEMLIIQDGVNKLRNDETTHEVIYQAYLSAKKIIEKFVMNQGEMMGKTYTVEWVQDTDNVQNSTDEQPVGLSLIHI